MHFIGIDLGGTKIEGAVLDEDRAVLDRRRVPTPPDYAGIVDTIGRMVSDMRPAGDCTLGVGAPGTTGRDGRIANSNTGCIRGMPLHRDLEKATGMRIRMGNDADCFAVAEARMGAGAGFETVFGVIMGTGVGGGLVVRNRIWRGRTGAAGEWGHSTLHPDGNPCWCGRRGCVETYISGPALEERWLRQTGARMSVPQIVSSKPPGFKRWRDSFVGDFGVALSGAVQILDPDAIILGGGLSNIPFLYDAGAEALHQNVLHGGTPVLRNALGDSAGVVGAALLGAGQSDAAVL